MEEHVSVYLDDIIIHSSAEDHLKIIEDVFNRFEEANLVVNESECAFGRRKIEYLGYQIEQWKDFSFVRQSGICEKMAQLEERSETIFGRLYRSFIPNSENLVEPLPLLLRKRIEFGRRSN